MGLKSPSFTPDPLYHRFYGTSSFSPDKNFNEISLDATAVPVFDLFCPSISSVMDGEKLLQ